MRCPKCNHQEDKVIDSRSIKEGAAVRRRRECTACAFRYTTHEEILNDDVKVVKKGDIREDFNREKIRLGISKACLFSTFLTFPFLLFKYFIISLF
jgi:transcriptional repressor NrdR